MRVPTRRGSTAAALYRSPNLRFTQRPPDAFSRSPITAAVATAGGHGDGVVRSSRAHPLLPTLKDFYYYYYYYYYNVRFTDAVARSTAAAAAAALFSIFVLVGAVKNRNRPNGADRTRRKRAATVCLCFFNWTAVVRRTE